MHKYCACCDQTFSFTTDTCISVHCAAGQESIINSSVLHAENGIRRTDLQKVLLFDFICKSQGQGHWVAGIKLQCKWLETNKKYYTTLLCR